MSGTLYFGDNLSVMRDYLKDETVDLIYLDPPFNSNANYNVLFKSPLEPATAQVRAFEDTWRWGNEAQAAFEEVEGKSPNTFRLLLALKTFLGSSDVMAYLAMMAIRLVEMQRILKSTGTLYLHCDTTASHYLKVLLDGIFGADRFQNEIIWQRTTPKGHAFTRFPSTHDVILSYKKGASATWNTLFVPHRQEYVESHYRNIEPETGRRYMLDNCLNPNRNRPNLTYKWNGIERVWRWTQDKMQQLHDGGRLVYTKSGMPRYKRYLDEMQGTPVTSVWTDIAPVNSQAAERIGYPTQKPMSLLQRIVSASSNAGDTILDPFCGCGTAIHAAGALKRNWIGIDVTYVAIKVIQDRLKQHLPNEVYKIRGIPRDEDSVRKLAEQNPHEFQNWAVSVLGGHPKGRGADRGIDGEITFKKGSEEYGRAIVSVKGGKNISPSMMRELVGTVNREKADLGVFVCLGPATKEMQIEAANAGRAELPGGKKPKIQIVTASDLLAGPNLGIYAVFDTVTGAAEARKVAGKKKGAPKKPDPRQKNMMLPLTGGITQEAARGKMPQYAFHEEQAPPPTKRKRRKA